MAGIIPAKPPTCLSADRQQIEGEAEPVTAAGPRPVFIDLLLTNRNNKSPNVIDTGDLELDKERSITGFPFISEQHP